MSPNERRVAQLRPRARLMQHLGEDLIPNDRVALVELVKNAYDADATTVLVRFVGDKEASSPASIEIWDDGHGMDAQVIEQVWLEIATPHRVQNKMSESGARRVLGAKGLGRFSVARLASRLRLETRRDSLEEILLETDWDDFTDSDAYLADVSIHWEVRVPETFAANGEAERLFRKVLGDVDPDDKTADVRHGTVLRLLEPRSEWTESERALLTTALGRLTPPTPPQELDVPDVPSFRVLVDAGTDDAPEVIAPSATIAHPAYRLLGTVGADGTAALTFTTSHSDADETFTVNLRGGSQQESCGAVKLDLRVWDLDRDGLADIVRAEGGRFRLRDVRELIRQNSGVSLYRDGFRVQPYGDAENDWLGLGQRRVNNPTMRVSNNQVVGFLYVTADDNPELRDQANRQGLIDNDALDDLRHVVTGALDLLEQRRFRLRRGLDTPEGERGRAKGVFDAFRLDNLKEVVAANYADADELRQAVADAERDIKHGVQGVQEVISRFTRLATLGSLVDVIVHEGNTALAMQNYALDELEELVDGKDTECAATVRKARRELVEQTESLGRLFDGIEPLSGRRRGRPRRVALHKVVQQAVDLLRGELDEQGVIVTLGGVDSTVTVDPADIYQVVVNLLRNAIHWTSTTRGKGDRKIAIETGRGDGWVSIEVADNGPGVPAGSAPYVFDAYYTTREGGTGLGLNIAGSIVQDFYGGSLELVPSTGLPGARFRATLRRRIG